MGWGLKPLDNSSGLHFLRNCQASCGCSCSPGPTGLQVPEAPLLLQAPHQRTAAGPAS